MPRRLALLLALAALVAVTGCGEDEKEKFIGAYRPLNDRLLKVGEDLGAGLQNAGGKTNKQLAREFAAYALRLESINRDIAALDTPSDLRDESEALTTQIEATVKSLKDISGAAGANDPQAAAAATVELGTSSQALNRAQNKLAKATGAKVGSS